ncbi:MAG: hypothetical protein COT14_02480 [Candidatus Diapherotrites archaeon CG08_land_8_20_14_0_20_30_16]|nr:MAG: hypothetical protein COT14_02480 [Candidatus Diapherotrites archaeon CG08_land_8_20_14_0_20_30_16]
MLLVVLVQSYDIKDNLAKLKKDTKMLVFDMDGTIVNVTNIELDLFAKLFHKPKRFFVQFFGPPSKILIKNAFPNLSERKIVLYNHLWEKKYQKEIKRREVVTQDTKDLLKKLKKKYILGIITSSIQRVAILTLKDSLCLFDFVLTPKDYNHPKPNPESLNKIIKQYKLRPKNIIYIGDNINDILFGKNAKTKTIGKIDVLYSKNNLIKYNPDAIIKDFKELKCLI